MGEKGAPGEEGAPALTAVVEAGEEAASIRSVLQADEEGRNAEAVSGAEASTAPDSVESEKEAAPRREVLRIFDPEPVLDSLRAMKIDLQDIRFQLGEILLFDLNEPDSARVIFRELAAPQNADTVRARAILAQAYVAATDSDQVLYDSLLAVLADRFPQTEIGAYAVRRLGRTLPEKPLPPDEAAFHEAEEFYFTPGSDPQDAYTRYRWVAETYPTSPRAPEALYAAAFIAGKELGDGITAEELLRRLVDKYPASPQATKADQLLRSWERAKLAAASSDTTMAKEEPEVVQAVPEEELTRPPALIGGMEAIASILNSRNLLPPEVISGTGGDVLLRYIVDPEGKAGHFRVVAEDPPGNGLARALITALEEVTFHPGEMDGAPVAARVERRYTLPLDAPPNIRPLPRRRRS
ncbi:MAG TPA: hypothetical protein ENI92_09235 [Bacteroidetes bacterium]|nr:hypothetical protein [Bacteroidota bacterium]